MISSNVSVTAWSGGTALAALLSISRDVLSKARPGTTRRAERLNWKKRGMSLKWGRGLCTEDEDGGLWEGEKSRGRALTGPQYGTTGISI